MTYRRKNKETKLGDEERQNDKIDAWIAKKERKPGVLRVLTLPRIFTFLFVDSDLKNVTNHEDIKYKAKLKSFRMTIKTAQKFTCDTLTMKVHV